MSSRSSASAFTTPTASSTFTLDVVVPPVAKERYVHTLFDRISPRYDLFNRLASLGMDQHWRRRAIAAAGLQSGMRVLDLGAGTGDLALLAARSVGPTGWVGALDLSVPMLRLARAKAGQGDDRAHPINGRAEALPLPDGGLDAVVSAFCMRNVSDLDRTLSESFRVLTTGGRLVILEFGRPRAAILRWGHRGWLSRGALLIGWLVTGMRWPFDYLRRSIAGFLDPEEFMDRLRAAGFAEATAIPLLGGTVIIYKAVKSIGSRVTGQGSHGL